MASETDSDSPADTLSEQERKRNKLHKKLKKKLEKIHKGKKKKSRKDKKKRSRKDRAKSSDEDEIKIRKPTASPKMLEQVAGTNEDVDMFGPALPQHLLNKNEVEENKSSIIGPMIPKELLGNIPEKIASKELPDLGKSKTEEDDNLQDSYGPLPVTNELEMTKAQVELEQRALELKMAAIDGINAPSSNQNVREEWMLELPDVGLKSGLAALNNLKRGFHQGKEKPDFSDRSSWTKTPNTCQEKQKPSSSKAELELVAQTFFEKQRDAEQEDLAKKHKKKHKRDQSLMEIHQKKLRAEEKKKAKELKAIGAKPERRPFTRDVDLKLNKIDRNQTKQIVDKAKILNTKFSSGHSKYL